VSAVGWLLFCAGISAIVCGGSAGALSKVNTDGWANSSRFLFFAGGLLTGIGVHA